MTFQQIADESGLPLSSVFSAYTSGMRKLRTRNPHAMRLLKGLGDELSTLRTKRNRRRS